VGLSPLGTAVTTGLLYQPQMIDDSNCGAIGGIKIGGGTRSTRRKPALMPLCSPQIPHGLTRARTQAATVGRQRLTASAMTQPIKSRGRNHMNLMFRKKITIPSVVYCSEEWITVLRQRRRGRKKEFNLINIVVIADSYRANLSKCVFRMNLNFILCIYIYIKQTPGL
jgi:hypothetical protein